MGNRLGITKSKVYAIEFAGFYRILDGEYYENKDVLDKSKTPGSEVKANTKLIVDSFETANKTGLLPSELLEQRNKLITEIKNLRERFRLISPCELYSNLHPYKTSGKLIKSIESND